VTFVGDHGDNAITTGAMSDTIYGGSGADNITFGQGGGIYVGYAADVIATTKNYVAYPVTAIVNGGSGDTHIFAPAGGGEFTTGGSGSYIVGGGSSETMTGGVGLTLAHAQQTIFGAQYDINAQDSIVGNSSGDATATLSVEAGIGSTTVTGGAESDVIIGNTGDLSVDGANGLMTVEAAASSSGITPDTTVNANGVGSLLVYDTPSANAVLEGNLTVIGGSGDLSVFGTDSNKGEMVVAGGLGSATIVGNGGEDQLALGLGGGGIWGGSGKETLVGGLGGTSLLVGGSETHATAASDVFVVLAPSGTDSTVQIEGFRSGTDILDLRSFGLFKNDDLSTSGTIGQVTVEGQAETAWQVDLQYQGGIVHLQLVGGPPAATDLATQSHAAHLPPGFTQTIGFGGGVVGDGQGV
jgi:Ca2+-binding RTX toxin-like protein